MEPLADPAIQLAHLKTRLVRVQEMAARIEEPSPQISSLVGRLEDLVKDTEEAIAAGPVRETQL
jgi:hypothetical protein